MEQRSQIICKICGKEFRGYASRKTCSKQCQSEYFKTALVGKNNPNYRHGKNVENKCKNCGIDIDPRSLKCKACAGLEVSISLEMAIEAAKSTNSYLKMGEYLGVSRGKAKSLVEDYNIDISHFRGARERYTSPEKLLCKGNVARNNVIISLILREELLVYKCDACGLGDNWNGLKLKIQLHHKNGDNTDNRIENLQFLCPNCHSQTETYVGKNSIGVRKCRKGKK